MNIRLHSIPQVGLMLVLLLPARLLGQSATDIAKIVNAVSYGVPTSPAFELLPGKTAEVVNLLTPQDFATNITNIYDGKKLKTGAAFDIRPFSGLAGSLTQYQQNRIRQIAWRAQFSLGTAPDETVKGDVFLSGGLRIPIFDCGDPRANKTFIGDLEKAFTVIIPPPASLTFNVDSFDRAVKAKVSSLLDSTRKVFFKTNWNRPKLDAGFAYMIRAKSGAVIADSLSGDRYGLWLASGLPLSSFGQLTISGKITRSVNVPWPEAETGRNTLGARARIFPPGVFADRMALSVEFASIWATYAQADQSESWRHVAFLVEYHIPALKGWVGLAYGGDTPHRTSAGNKFSFSYAVYTNQILKK